MFRLNSCVNGVIIDSALEFFIRKAVKLCARYRLRRIGDYAKLKGYGNGGILVVACYHYRTDSRRAAGFYSVKHFGTHGVYHSAETYEYKVMFECARRIFGRLGIERLACCRKNTECLVSHFFVLAKYFRMLFIGKRLYSLFGEYLRTAAEKLIRSAFGVLNVFSVLSFVYGCHHLAHRIERDLADSGLFCFCFGFDNAVCGCKVYKRTFRRLAYRIAVFVGICVGAERHCRGKKLLVCGAEIGDGHLVLGKSACLIRADDFRTTECFNGCKTAYYSGAL